MDLSEINILIIFWLMVFVFLSFNIGYMFTCSVFALFFSFFPQNIKENYLSELPPTAIVYTIRGESCGLFERINFTFENNYLNNVDLWILSGEAPKEFKQYEQIILEKLENKYGSRVKYLQFSDPQKKKQEMIEEWLEKYSYTYKYFVVCDADSMLPKDFLLKMLRKAEEPQNNDIAIFQSSITIINAKTYYSHFIKIGTKIGQELYNTTQQMAFKQSFYWGHNALVRTEIFRKVLIPAGVLSHDIWETVYLHSLGYRTVFCHDITSFEESPANYLEDKKRSARWAKGNFEAWSLIFKKNVSLANRFYLFFGIYGYITNIIFFIWVFSGMFFEKANLWQSNMRTNYLLTLLIFATIFLHKLAICKKFRDLLQLMYEIFISTIMGLNSIFYMSLIIVLLPFQKKCTWIPMKKNPYETVTLIETVKEMWPGTLVGMISLYIACNYTPIWGLYSIPILFSLIFSIPIVYFTSRLKIQLISPLKVLFGFKNRKEIAEAPTQTVSLKI